MKIEVRDHECALILDDKGIARAHMNGQDDDKPVPAGRNVMRCVILFNSPKAMALVDKQIDRFIAEPPKPRKTAKKKR